MASNIIIDHLRCVGCGDCVSDCPSGALVLRHEKAYMVEPQCMECGHCFAVCSLGAIRMEGYDLSEVMELDRRPEDIQPEAFLNHLKMRRSIRRYRKMPVEDDKLRHILEAGRYTPTAQNLQDVRYIVVRHPERNIEKAANHTLQQLQKMSHKVRHFSKQAAMLDRMEIGEGFLFHGAPVAILVVAKNQVDASLASANLATMAEAEGLGVLFVGLFVTAVNRNKKLEKRLGLEGGEKIVTALAVGYPDVDYKRTVPRKKVNVTFKGKKD